MVKLTNRELDRIDAYRVKCFENALSQGKDMATAMRAYIDSEKAASRAVLGETRSGLRGWWNGFEDPDKEAFDSEAVDELICVVCEKASDEIETLVRYEGRFVCETCLCGLPRSLSH